MPKNKKYKRGSARALVKIIRECIDKMGLIFVCGNGGSSAETEHLVSEFVTHGIPAISLNNPAVITALANDYSYDVIFSKQIEVLGHQGDILIGLSTSGKSKNILNAYRQAKKQGLVIIDWPRKGKDTAKIQEYQLKLMHRVYKKICK